VGNYLRTRYKLEPRLPDAIHPGGGFLAVWLGSLIAPNLTANVGIVIDNADATPTLGSATGRRHAGRAGANDKDIGRGIQSTTLCDCAQIRITKERKTKTRISNASQHV
jgi:hypothetical protein